MTSYLTYTLYIRYTNKGNNEMVDLLGINTNDPDSKQCSMKFLQGNTMVVTKELLKSSNVLEIG